MHYLEELVSKHANLCSGKMPETDLVGCYTHFADRQMNLNQPSKGYLSVADDYGSDDIDGIIETTVSDLSPDTTYRFDLLAEPVHRAHSQQLPYRTVWVKTRAFC